MFEREVRGDRYATHRLCRGRRSAGLKLLDRGLRGGSAILTLTLGTRGATVGVDAWISIRFSEIKIPAPSSSGIFVGENKCYDQGTVLLLKGEDEARENIPLCAPVGSPGATEHYSMVTRNRHPFSRRFPFSLVSPVIAVTFPFAWKTARTSSLKTKNLPVCSILQDCLFMMYIKLKG